MKIFKEFLIDKAKNSISNNNFAQTPKISTKCFSLLKNIKKAKNMQKEKITQKISIKPKIGKYIINNKIHQMKAVDNHKEIISKCKEHNN